MVLVLVAQLAGLLNIIRSLTLVKQALGQKGGVGDVVVVQAVPNGRLEEKKVHVRYLS